MPGAQGAASISMSRFPPERKVKNDGASSGWLVIGLKGEDFQNATPIFECLAHTSATIRGMLFGSLPENRTSALVNETMIFYHSEEFNTYLRKHYSGRWGRHEGPACGPARGQLYSWQTKPYSPEYAGGQRADCTDLSL